MQVELLEAKTETFGPLGRQVAAMSAATSPGRVWLRPAAGRAAWGMARSSFYAMTSGQHAEQPPAKRRGPKPAISDQALLVAIRSRPGGIALGGRGLPQGLGSASGLCDIRVARKRVLRLMRENICSRHRCRRRGAIPMTVRSSLMPRPHVGHRWRSGVHGGRRLGRSSPPSSIGTPIGWHCKPATASPPCSRSPWGLPGCMARPRPARLLRMDHGSQYLSDHFTNQIKFWGIQPSYAFVAEPRPTASPSGSIAR